ncbi:MAG: hypothetical protein HC890_17570 [Chloroflexaceae bacterium]|nr:hypothetical protein [Chloroflexaceae bacterium]
MYYKTLGTGIVVALLAALPLGNYVSPAQAQIIAQNTTVEDVADDPTQLIGRTVTLRGATETSDRPYSFILKDEDLFGLIDDAEVLVINLTGGPLPTRPKDDIEFQVTGRVGRFLQNDILEVFGLNLSDPFYDEYEDRPVVFAQSIALSPSPDEIFDSPQSYYSRPVAVKGEVEQVLSNNAFTVEDDEIVDEVLGARDLLVINASGSPALSADQKLVITGTIRPLSIAQLEQEYNIRLDAETREKLGGSNENPVLIADGVYPVNE